MRKTLLLVFIHGFKGGDDTFGTFPEHLRTLVTHALPNIDVVALQYPRFETRGELHEVVAKFREWLENKVIDLEVNKKTPSPTIDPSVHTILIGHSMGGIVAAETLLLLANERQIPSHSLSNDSQQSTTPSFMFPHIHGVLAFDTPYLGLAPEMVAYGLEGGHKMASSALSTANEVAGIFGWGSKTSSGAGAAGTARTAGALPAPVIDATKDAAATPRWQTWGKYAMFAGAAGAVAAGGAAALYTQREKISAGWMWATSHLLFVSDLAKGEILRKRVEGVEQTVCERGLGGFVNFYTNLGRGAREGYGITEKLAGRERTFCNLPTALKNGTGAVTQNATPSVAHTPALPESKLQWIKAVNDKATDETTAHISMFFPRDNPGFYSLSERATETISTMVDSVWYESSDGADGASASRFDRTTTGSIGREWEGLNHHDVTNDEDHGLEMRDEHKENEDMLEDSVIIEDISSSRKMESSERKGGMAGEQHDSLLD